MPLTLSRGCLSSAGASFQEARMGQDDPKVKWVPHADSLRGVGKVEKGLKGEANAQAFSSDVTPRPAPPSAPVSNYSNTGGTDGSTKKD